MLKEKLDRKKLLLYAVTDRAWSSDLKTFYEQIEQSLKAGVTFLQLREKTLDKENFLNEAKEIKKICANYNVPFIINDNIEIAQEVNADGIHIGQNDISLVEAKELIGNDKIIGVTVHSIEEALDAEKNGASYLGVGAIFKTNSKEDAKVINIDELKKISSSVNVPVVAIGGIKKNNLSILNNTGIAGIAVISAIYSHKDIYSATRELKKTLITELNF